MPSFTFPARRTAALLAGLTLTVVALAACGDDGTSSGDTTTTAAGAPEAHQAPMEEVLAGLPTIKQAGAGAATAAVDGDFEAVLAKYEEMHEVWEEVEGTIKATDIDTYEAIETAQGLIKDGGESKNAERVSQGADDQAAAVDSFIAANS